MFNAQGMFGSSLRGSITPMNRIAEEIATVIYEYDMSTKKNAKISINKIRNILIENGHYELP